MSKPQLVIIPVEGRIDMKVFAGKDLEGGCPKFELMRQLAELPPDTTLEMLRLRYQGGPAYMFMDEDGLMNRRPINERATLLANRMIVGPVVVWTGKLE